MSLLEVKDLHVSFRGRRSVNTVVRGVDFTVQEGEVVGLVGESGSGKSTTALAITRLLHTLSSAARVDKGQVVFSGQDLLKLPEKEMQKIRGAQIGFISQDPDLNEIMTVEDQLAEIPGRRMGKSQLADILTEVGIPDPEARMKNYPLELSGGMKQRVMIAMMALVHNPRLLIADEPTTALDVTVQAHILDLLHDIVRKTNKAMLLVTHNLALVAEYADRVLVMREGEIVEQGNVEDVFQNPSHPYTRKLLRAVPRLDVIRREIPAVAPGVSSALKIEGLKVHFPQWRGVGILRRKIGSFHAVDGLDLSVREGETLGIVGESGCGKTTFARTIMRLIPQDEVEQQGEVLLGPEGEDWDIFSVPIKQFSKFRSRNIQLLPQHAHDKLNPRRSCGDLVVEGLIINKRITPLQCDEEARRLFELVKLDPSTIDRFPAQFSSGQRQRISIARALALEPKVLVLDEPVASLDVSIQEEIVDLLLELKKKLNLTYIVISHDLALVKDIAHRIGVMYLGRIIELGPSWQVMQNPLHPYTKALLSAVPILDPAAARRRKRIRLQGEVPSGKDIPSGCRFRTRCPLAEQGVCDIKELELEEKEPGHFVACYKV